MKIRFCIIKNIVKGWASVNNALRQGRWLVVSKCDAKPGMLETQDMRHDFIFK